LEVSGLESWIDFGGGPLFRLCFSLMILGLLRILFLTLFGAVQAFRQSADRILPWKDMAVRTATWLIPATRLFTKRPLYSAVSFAFHLGLIATPLLLAAHVLLWRRALGFGWPTLPQNWANWLTLTVVATGLALFLGRAGHRGARALSRGQDYLWPLLLIVPFLTGYGASNLALSPESHQAVMLIHIYSANLIMVLIPFTKIAHCVLMPLSHLVTGISWKFPAGAGDRVAATLGYADRGSWVPKSRLGGRDACPDAPVTEVFVK
jgi:nitrate reductase gamma subunit